MESTGVIEGLAFLVSLSFDMIVINIRFCWGLLFKVLVWIVESRIIINCILTKLYNTYIHT